MYSSRIQESSKVCIPLNNHLDIHSSSQSLFEDLNSSTPKSESKVKKGFKPKTFFKPFLHTLKIQKFKNSKGKIQKLKGR